MKYRNIREIFYQNDFNWKVTPSNTETKEFQQVYAQIKSAVMGCHCGRLCPLGYDPQSPEIAGDSCFRRNDGVLLFDFEKDEKELRRFIKQNYIVERRDLLVPQDVRERKGSFFTPQIWVELSQKYIADVLGKDWQDEYTVWDCAAGTGNLLAGLTNKYNVWASTLDKQDVDVMKDRIKNGANLLEDHVFQFDFLNDDFDKLPDGLKKIIDNEEKRKKLVIYINPPYAETMSKTGTDKTGLNISMVNEKYIKKMGDCANRELFVQFLTRIYVEIPSATIANFSTLKNLQSPNFKDFRTYFSPKLEKIFIVPAYTFDNVKGQFPIGFMIWNTSIKEPFNSIVARVFDEHGASLETKEICSYDNVRFINEWIITTRNRINEKQLGFMSAKGNDFQNANYVYIINDKKQLPAPRGSWVTDKNLIECCIYIAVRKCIEATWLNDRDQFLYPNDGYKTDTEFQNDCLAYTLFSNNIQSQYGTNHWIPFTEYQVAARDKFDSNFMTDFIAGKTPSVLAEPDLFYFAAGNSGGGGYGQTKQEPKLIERKFSSEATEVFNAGRALWRYYHQQPNGNVNASLYDIREHFQGRNEKGKMNNKSENETYMNLIADLRDNLKILVKKIEPKVYEYGFLKG
jgi:predicted RNA methylase